MTKGSAGDTGIMGPLQAWQLFLAVIFLPFLNTAVSFVWGGDEALWVIVLKRGLLLLPVLTVIFCYWVTVVGLLTVPFRSDRKAFVTTLLVTWWELGRGILTFWGGILKCLFAGFSASLGFFRLLLVGVWGLAQDILFMPLRAVANMGESILNPGLPWIAIALTLVWSVFEGIIFAFVMSPLVVETLSSMTGSELKVGFIRFPVFLFMFFLVLGSYSVLATWSEALAKKDVPAIIKIGAIELVAMFVEVVFLYREFVDALIPWFAQHTAGGFEPGIFGILAIAGATWFGVRAVSWFLFASSGTPVIMAIIQGKAVKAHRGHAESVSKKSLTLTTHLIHQMSVEREGIEKYGDAVLGAFVLPPLQVIGVAVNFFSLLVVTQHLFELPFRSLDDLKDTKTLLKMVGVTSQSAQTERNRA